MDDKLDSMHKLNKNVILLSAMGSLRCALPNTIHYLVPSISWIDLKVEISSSKDNKQNIGFVWIFIPLLAFLGFLSDQVIKVISKGSGGGKHSWAITSFIASLYCVIRYDIELIFSSGGAASSHVSALALSIITKKPLIVELQDPLCGHGIGRNSKSIKLLRQLESLLVRYSSKVVFVTEQAANEAKSRYRKNNITSIYPGAKVFLGPSEGMGINDRLRFLHLGTLYTSRNFDTLTQAFDELIEEKKVTCETFELVNLGEIYGEYRENYLKRPYFKQIKTMERKKALEIAKSSFINLIVQHSDPRSTTTIPYKLYDYLNLRRPILGLTNNDELNELLLNQNHFAASISDVAQIKSVILKIIQSAPIHNYPKSSIDAVEQTKKLLKI